MLYLHDSFLIIPMNECKDVIRNYFRLDKQYLKIQTTALPAKGNTSCYPLFSSPVTAYQIIKGLTSFIANFTHFSSCISKISHYSNKVIPLLTEPLNDSAPVLLHENILVWPNCVLFNVTFPSYFTISNMIHLKGHEYCSPLKNLHIFKVSIFVIPERQTLLYTKTMTISR